MQPMENTNEIKFNHAFNGLQTIEIYLHDTSVSTNGPESKHKDKEPVLLQLGLSRSRSVLCLKVELPWLGSLRNPQTNGCFSLGRKAQPSYIYTGRFDFITLISIF